MDLSEFRKLVEERVNKNTLYFKYGSSIRQSLDAVKNGGERTLDVLGKQGVTVKYFVDSNPLKWNKKVRGLEVRSPSELKMGDVVVVGSVYEKEIAKELNRMGVSYLPCILSLCEFDIEGSEIYNNWKNLLTVWELLGDEESKGVFLSLLVYLIDGDASKIVVSDYKHYFHPIVSPIRGDVVVDAGAYSGDTIKEIICELGKDVVIYAFEPDEENYSKLEESVGEEDVFLVKAALWSKSMRLGFNGVGDMFSHIDGGKGKYYVNGVSLDTFFENVKETPTLIKMDIEGAEVEALKGAKEIVKKYKPKLQVSVYHRTSHIWEIPLLLRDWVPGYRMFLGHHTQTWYDSVLYCIMGV